MILLFIVLSFHMINISVSFSNRYYILQVIACHVMGSCGKKKEKKKKLLGIYFIFQEVSSFFHHFLIQICSIFSINQRLRSIFYFHQIHFQQNKNLLCLSPNQINPLMTEQEHRLCFSLNCFE